MSRDKGFWEGAHCMWCGAVEGSVHTAWCKRDVGITDGPSKSAIDAHRFAQPVTEQATVSGLPERIEEVVEAHRPLRVARDPHFEDCAAGCRYAAGEWYRHLAERVAAELNLTEETRELADGMGGVTTNWKTGETTHHFRACTRQRRWVSRWEEKQ